MGAAAGAQAAGAVGQGIATYISLEAGDAASRVARGDAEIQAKQIELGAVQREADRKEALNIAVVVVIVLAYLVILTAR